MRGPWKDLTDQVALEDFEMFFRREHPRLLTLAFAMVGDREVACELVQESLLRAFHSWPKIAQLERPGGWTRRVLVNLCVDLHRRRGREQRALERSLPVSTFESPELPSATFWASVRRLPRLQCSVVALHYVDDLSVMEIAEVLGVSSGSVKTSLSRARASLGYLLFGSDVSNGDSKGGVYSESKGGIFSTNDGGRTWTVSQGSVRIGPSGISSPSGTREEDDAVGIASDGTTVYVIGNADRDGSSGATKVVSSPVGAALFTDSSPLLGRYWITPNSNQLVVAGDAGWVVTFGTPMAALGSSTARGSRGPRRAPSRLKPRTPTSLPYRGCDWMPRLMGATSSCCAHRPQRLQVRPPSTCSCHTTRATASTRSPNGWANPGVGSGCR